MGAHVGGPRDRGAAPGQGDHRPLRRVAEGVAARRRADERAHRLERRRGAGPGVCARAGAASALRAAGREAGHRSGGDRRAARPRRDGERAREEPRDPADLVGVLGTLPRAVQHVRADRRLAHPRRGRHSRRGAVARPRRDRRGRPCGRLDVRAGRARGSGERAPGEVAAGREHGDGRRRALRRRGARAHRADVDPRAPLRGGGLGGPRRGARVDARVRPRRDRQAPRGGLAGTPAGDAPRGRGDHDGADVRRARPRPRARGAGRARRRPAGDGRVGRGRRRRALRHRHDHPGPQRDPRGTRPQARQIRVRPGAPQPGHRPRQRRREPGDDAEAGKRHGDPHRHRRQSARQGCPPREDETRRRQRGLHGAAPEPRRAPEFVRRLGRPRAARAAHRGHHPAAQAGRGLHSEDVLVRRLRPPRRGSLARAHLRRHRGGARRAPGRAPRRDQVHGRARRDAALARRRGVRVDRLPRRPARRRAERDGGPRRHLAHRPGADARQGAGERARGRHLQAPGAGGRHPVDRRLRGLRRAVRRDRVGPREGRREGARGGDHRRPRQAPRERVRGAHGDAQVRGHARLRRRRRGPERRVRVARPAVDVLPRRGPSLRGARREDCDAGRRARRARRARGQVRRGVHRRRRQGPPHGGGDLRRALRAGRRRRVDALARPGGGHLGRGHRRAVVRPRQDSAADGDARGGDRHGPRIGVHPARRGAHGERHGRGRAPVARRRARGLRAAGRGQRLGDGAPHGQPRRLPPRRRFRRPHAARRVGDARARRGAGVVAPRRADDAAVPPAEARGRPHPLRRARGAAVRQGGLPGRHGVARRVDRERGPPRRHREADRRRGDAGPGAPPVGTRRAARRGRGDAVARHPRRRADGGGACRGRGPRVVVARGADLGRAHRRRHPPRGPGARRGCASSWGPPSCRAAPRSSRCGHPRSRSRSRPTR